MQFKSSLSKTKIQQSDNSTKKKASTLFLQEYYFSVFNMLIFSYFLFSLHPLQSQMICHLVFVVDP